MKLVWSEDTKRFRNMNLFEQEMELFHPFSFLRSIFFKKHYFRSIQGLHLTENGIFWTGNGIISTPCMKIFFLNMFH